MRFCTLTISHTRLPIFSTSATTTSPKIIFLGAVLNVKHWRNFYINKYLITLIYPFIHLVLRDISVQTVLGNFMNEIIYFLF